MVKFHLISTELWPLIGAKKLVSALYLEHLLTFFFKLCIRFDIGKEWFGIVDG